jgi:antitoxin (DNA-binding transcriptional repressor) of toxin-antitoxin stability system
MKVSAQYAQSHLDELLDTADHGVGVVIAREGKPTYMLHLVDSPELPKKTGPRILGAGVGDIILGAGRGELTVPTDEEWRAMKEEDARLMNDACA